MKSLFAAMPVPGVNQPGKVARNALVSRFKAATPGRATTPYIGVKGKFFRELFCPNYRAMPYENMVDSVTGKNNSFWETLSVGVMCQAMYHITSRLRPQIQVGNADRDIGGWNGQIFSSGANWYAYVLPRDPGAVKDAYDRIPAASRPTAQQLYSNILKSNEWITAKRAAYLSGQWTDRSWELYHHWVKLQALGASKTAIDAVIAYVLTQELPVPTDVNAQNWPSYRGWSPDLLSWRDVQDDANKGMLVEVCYVYPGSMFPSCMTESNSFEFTAKSQPGNKYRQPPKSSCFLAGAQVVMGDRSLKPIEQVQVGDSVLTLTGPAPVGLVSTPLRAGRPMYSFEGFGFQFSNTQPFVTYDSLYMAAAPRLACIEPLRLIDAVPTLSQEGVVGIAGAVGPRLSKLGPVDLQAFDTPPLQESPGSSDVQELVYELIVHVAGAGVSDYFVGDQNVALLVSPETPKYQSHPEASEALVLTLEGCAESVLETIAPASDADIGDVLQVGMSSVAGLLLANVLRIVAASPAPPDRLPGLRGVDRVERLVGGVVASLQSAAKRATTPVNRLSSVYTSLVEAFGVQYAGALDIGWRNFRFIQEQFATVLSVSAYSVELDGTVVLPAGTPISLQIALGYGGQEFVQRLPALPPPRSGYYYGFGQVAYFDVWRAGVQTQLGWSLAFTVFRDDTGEALGITASAELPASLEGGFRAASALVLDPAGRQSGRINYDLRAMDEATYDLEQIARRNWTPEKKLALAQALGTEAGKYVAARFPEAAKLFNITCSYQSEDVYPPIDQPAA
ncbi:MAG TPA: hypothetical protein VEU96_17405 [Bryobacteraceae bacterium]|nr:hypothetical protein [Bryobacteraceae bacterium]